MSRVAVAEYLVVFGSGTDDTYHWRVHPDTFDNLASALLTALDLERFEFGTVKTVILSKSQFDVVGLPIGPKPGAVDWERDHIVYVAGEFTEWRRGTEDADRSDQS